MEILVGNKDRDNDYLIFKVASAQDFWLHVADNSGAHVIIRNDNKVKRLLKTRHQATSLATYHSKSELGLIPLTFCPCTGRINNHLLAEGLKSFECLRCQQI